MIRRAAPFAFPYGLLVCALLSGCAAPGDPTPRHPVIPAAVADLAARQLGSSVELAFTLPTRSANRESLAEAPSIEIYRSALPAGAVPDRKTPWRLAYTIPSEQVDSYRQGERIEFRDSLPADEFARAVGSTLAYMVRTRAATRGSPRTFSVNGGRASQDSNLIAARIYSPPEAPRDVHVAVTKPALIVAWTDSALPPGASSRVYRVYRAEIENGQQSSPSDISQAKLKVPLELVGPAAATEFRDSRFEFGTSYLYTVRSVAQFGPDSVESADSAPAVVTPLDLFPPATPAGLEIAIVPATPQAPAYVELSWSISPEADLAGYFVYRSDKEDTPGQRANQELLPSPAFRDISVLPGRRYFYRVSAVNRAGNESPRSAAAEADIP